MYIYMKKLVKLGIQLKLEVVKGPSGNLVSLILECEEIHCCTKKCNSRAMLTKENRSAFSLLIRLDLAQSDLCSILIL